MKQFRSLISLGLILGMGVMLLTGCGAKQKKTEIYFLSCKPEVADVWAEVADVYEAQTGVRVKVLTAADGNHERTLKAEIAKKNGPTMFQINGPVEYEIWKDYCLDLSGTDLYSWMLDDSMAVKGPDGGAYGIPYVVEGYGIIYNQAIMNKYFSLPGKATPYNSMEEVNTYEKLKQVAEDMTAKKADLGIEGVFASTSFAPGEVWRWHTHLANLPVYYEFADKNIPDTDSIDFTYADNYKNIFDLYINYSVSTPAEIDTVNVEQSMAEFALGKCAMVQNGNWAWAQISSTDGCVVKEEDCKYLPMYTGVPGEESQGLCIGTENFICVNSQVSEELQQASIDFLEWLYSSEEGKAYIRDSFGFIPPFNTFDESEYPSNPLAIEVLNYMSDTNKKSVSWNFVAFPNQKFKDDLGIDLLSYAKGEIPWETLVSNTKTGWTAGKTAE